METIKSRAFVILLLCTVVSRNAFGAAAQQEALPASLTREGVKQCLFNVVLHKNMESLQTLFTRQCVVQGVPMPFGVLVSSQDLVIAFDIVLCKVKILALQSVETVTQMKDMLRRIFQLRLKVDFLFEKIAERRSERELVTLKGVMIAALESTSTSLEKSFKRLTNHKELSPAEIESLSVQVDAMGATDEPDDLEVKTEQNKSNP
jgi:hypothetical protein